MKPFQEDLIEAYTRPPSAVAHCTIWLHGLGVSASDMDGIIRNMRRSRELGLHYVAPNAPVRPITVNGGRASRAWFDVKGDPADVPEDREGIDDSTQRMFALLDAERGRGVPSESTVIGGFSQGASLALHAGLRYPHRLAGVVMLSGELVLADSLAQERHEANAQLPILMLHGTQDETIPMDDALRARDRLREAGHTVDWHEFPIGHAVSPEEIEVVDVWVERVLSAPRA